MIINIAKDFTTTPGPRFIEQGDKSGQEFRETLLIPNYEEAKKNENKLIIILDGTYGYFDSFLEEAFGGLKRKYPKDDVFKYIEFISSEDKNCVEKIKKFVNGALDK